jgi:hypothetical protein
VWGYVKLSLERDRKNEEKCMYLVCDFNGRWLKGSSLLCCIVIVLNVEVKAGYVMKVGCFLELIFLHFSKTKNNGLTMGNLWSTKLLATTRG